MEIRWIIQNVIIILIMDTIGTNEINEGEYYNWILIKTEKTYLNRVE